jgi:hypothetical protein
MHAVQDGPKPIEVGDAPGHMMGVGKAMCTWTKPMEIAGARSKEGTSVSFDDMMGDQYSGRGVHVSTMDSGDKIVVKFQGGGMIKDGKLTADKGTWSYAGRHREAQGDHGQGDLLGQDQSRRNHDLRNRRRTTFLPK